MKISKAVITAAGKTQRTLPLQRLVDKDGEPRTALSIIVAEALSAGIDEVCVVVHPGDEPAYRESLKGTAARTSFVAQELPKGYGHALFCARSFVGDEPFLHLISDHLYLSHEGETCAAQLVRIAVRESSSVSAVQATRESQLSAYGAIGGIRLSGSPDLYVVEMVLEKPSPTEAEQLLHVPGLRAGHYLCFFGMHVLKPSIMSLLEDEIGAAAPGQPVSLSHALARLSTVERYLAFEIRGVRHDIGDKYGLLIAQLALAFAGRDRDFVQTRLLELLLPRERGRG